MGKMKKLYNLVDKSTFSHGIWDNEPDEVEWNEQGFKCLIARVTGTGHLYGYVGVPKGHTLFKVQKDDFNVHGGVTFTNFIYKRSYWYIGFDCAHIGDKLPYQLNSSMSLQETYKDVNFVKKEIKHLIKQIKDYENGIK